MPLRGYCQGVGLVGVVCVIIFMHKQTFYKKGISSHVIKRFFLPGQALPPLRIAEILESGSPELDHYLGHDIYVNTDTNYLAQQRIRLAQTARLHAERVGDNPTYLLRAPGRLNAFLEYLDMCAGDHMSTTIDGDIPVCVSPREDDLLNVANVNQLFQPAELSISSEFNRFAEASWDSHVDELEDNWDNRSLIYPHHGRPQGNWLNYVLSPYMKVQWDHPAIRLKGADMTFGAATAPFRAGTSSSSAIVVLSFLALYLSNRDQLPEYTFQQVCKLLGEAEWYVGTHGGANDQTTILRNPVNSVLYNRHSQADLDSTPLPFVKGVHVVLANSLWEVNKTLGGNQSFNMRKGWMQMGDELMKLIIQTVREAQNNGVATGEGWISRLVLEKFGFVAGSKVPLLESNPEYWRKIEQNYHKFGSFHEDILGIPENVINELIMLLPVKITPDEAGKILGKDRKTIERIYTRPRRKIGGYHIRTTARFFHRENEIGRTLENIFLEADRRVTAGELSTDSPEYDEYRVRVGQIVDELQDAMSFDWRISIPQIDLLLTIARRGPGYLGGKLTGAGKGGCVSILVRENQSGAMCEYLDREYYGKPERFEFYRQVLEDERRDFEPGAPEHESAIERLQILDAALASIHEQRRVITFSRGACVLELPDK
jgi:galactokinase